MHDAVRAARPQRSATSKGERRFRDLTLGRIGTLRRLVNQGTGEMRSKPDASPGGGRIQGLLAIGVRDATAKARPRQLVNLGKWGLRKALEKEYPGARTTELHRKSPAGATLPPGAPEERRLSGTPVSHDGIRDEVRSQKESHLRR